LSYKEQRELEGLPALIEALEKEQADIRKALLDSALFTKDPATATALYARDAKIDTELLAALERWEILS
jgi:ATP-binding cassette subfamily F protein uup